MATEAGSESRGSAPDSHLAFLELLERPAALVAGESVVAANAAFRDFLADLGAGGLYGVRGFLAAESCERLARASSDAGLAEGDHTLVFRDGAARVVHVRVVERGGGPAVLFVIDHGGDSGAAALRHDIAGPLTAILGSAELLLLRSPELPEEVRGRLKSILENCGRITEMLGRSRAAGKRAGGGGA